MDQIKSNKIYKVKKTKNYIKINKFFIFYNSINKNSNEWLANEQEFKNIEFNYYKVFNKIINLTFKKSIYFNINPLISSVLILIKPKKFLNLLEKKKLINKFENMFFIFTALKLNNKIYSTNQIKKVNSLNYKDNFLILFHFLNANIKFSYIKIKSE